MIVLCTSCQAKFRVADEKIGPRGAKVRCSRCQNVFAVHREIGAVPLAAAPAPPAAPTPPAPVARPPRGPALDVELEPPARRATPPGDPFAFPPPEPPPSTRPDPFASATFDPFAEAPPAAPEADPFAWPTPEPAEHDLFAAGKASDPFQADPFGAPVASAPPFGAPDRGASDPFAAGFGDPADAPEHEAAPGAADPWAGTGSAALLSQAADGLPAAAAGSARALPLTDLADLLGAAPAPAEPPTAAAGDAAPPSGPDLTLEDRATPPAFRASGAGRDLSLGTFGESEPAFGGPGLALESEPAFSGPGLALESEPAFAFGGPGLELASQLATRPESSLAPGRDPSAALALGTEPTPAPAARAPIRPPPLPPAQRVAAAEEPVPLPDAPDSHLAVRAPPPAAVSSPARPPARRDARLAGLAVNAVALVALLVVALAMLVVWRGGRLEAAAFRPAAIAGALRHGAPAGPFAASDVRSGIYDRERGPPLLFVRGSIVSRAPAEVRSVRVTVEVVREGTVVARGEALAGAIPGPEDLWRAATPEALAEVARAAARRAPEEIRPGDEVPFLVAIDDYPPDVTGAALRISAAPGEARRR